MTSSVVEAGLRYRPDRAARHRLNPLVRQGFGGEVKQVVHGTSGTPQLIVKLLYGSGLRLMQALRLRVHDIDFGMKQLTVRDGKGAKDRFTIPAEGVMPPLREHLEQVRLTHREDTKFKPGLDRLLTCPFQAL